MVRLSILSLLVLALSSCIYVLEDESTTNRPGTPTAVASAPSPGSYTYRCGGGTLVVNYVDANQVRVFYDGGFRNLSLTRTGAVRAYEGGVYTWELRPGSGTLLVNGRPVLSNCGL